jgi:hypothetical protein
LLFLGIFYLPSAFLLMLRKFWYSRSVWNFIILASYS